MYEYTVIYYENYPHGEKEITFDSLIDTECFIKMCVGKGVYRVVTKKVTE